MKSSSAIDKPIRWKRATARWGALLGPFIVLAALFQPISSHANLITNGDFELSVPSNGIGNSWASINIDGSGGWRSTGGNPSGNFILNDNGNPVTDPTIIQFVSGLTASAMYRLQGDVACGNVCGTGVEHSFAVFAGGLGYILTRPIPLSGYEHFSVDFAATFSTQELQFVGEFSGYDIDPRIDNITLDLAPSQPVPEPGSLMLLLSGLAGVTGVALRRRSKQTS